MRKANVENRMDEANDRKGEATEADGMHKPKKGRERKWFFSGEKNNSYRFLFFYRERL